MKLPGPHLPQRHLQPGQLIVTRKSQWVVTLLGSCVAVTMFNARLPLAAICHAMLPKPYGNESKNAEPFRYLSRVIPAMAQPFFEAGLRPGDVEVKMFGGANVISMGGDPQSDRMIGSSNVDVARELLKSTGFHVRAQNVGGTCGCKIVFNTKTGEVLHKYLNVAEAGSSRR